jgi:hypothetical protein
MKRVAVIQSNYIPWKGYFDIINRVDEFIFYDCVQYTKNDWRNRNKIKSRSGATWLTIPVIVNSLSQTIRDTKVADPRWTQKHWRTLSQGYCHTAHFSDFKDEIESLYAETYDLYLCDINRKFVAAINRLLGVSTTLRSTDDFTLHGTKIDRLIDLLKQVHATNYLSGPTAKAYIDVEQFRTEGIEVEWMDYLNYPEYTQLFPPFDHNVSIMDLLFNEGVDAPKYMNIIRKNSGSAVHGSTVGRT